MLLIFAVTLPLSASSANTPKELLAKAQTHLAKGRYEEAEEVFHKAAAAKADPVAVAIGLSRAREAVGAWEEAEKLVVDASKQNSAEPKLLARLAELQLARGRLADAEKTAEAAITASSDNATARLVLADVYAQTGRFREANAGYRWFIRLYNSRQPEDAATLIVVARGSVQYARWNHNTQIFHFVVNTLCPDALKNDANAWEAHLISGSLLLEKYNREQAVPELEQALAINPRAAEAIVLLGQDALDNNEFDKAEAKATEALRINPRLPAALQLKADVYFLSGTHRGGAGRRECRTGRQSPRRRRARSRGRLRLLTDGLPSRSSLESWLAKPPIGSETKTADELVPLSQSLGRSLGNRSQTGRLFDRARRAARVPPPLRRGRGLLPPGDGPRSPIAGGENIAGHVADACRPHRSGPQDSR